MRRLVAGRQARHVVARRGEIRNERIDRQLQAGAAAQGSSLSQDGRPASPEGARIGICGRAPETLPIAWELCRCTRGNGHARVRQCRCECARTLDRVSRPRSLKGGSRDPWIRHATVFVGEYRRPAHAFRFSKVAVALAIVSALSRRHLTYALAKRARVKRRRRTHEKARMLQRSASSVGVSGSLRSRQWRMHFAHLRTRLRRTCSSVSRGRRQEPRCLLNSSGWKHHSG